MKDKYVIIWFKEGLTISDISYIFNEASGPFPAVFVVKEPAIFKAKHDVFLILTKWFHCL